VAPHHPGEPDLQQHRRRAGSHLRDHQHPHREPAHCRRPRRAEGDWTTPLPQETGATTAVIDGRVIIESGNYVTAFDAAKGTQLWSTPYPDGIYPTTDPVGNAAGLLLGFIDGTFASYDPATGTRQWSVPISAGENPVGEAVADGSIYVTTNNNILALDAKTGRQQWISHQPAVRVTPVAVNGMIITPSLLNGASSYAALDAATGTVLTEFPVQSDTLHAPIIADGINYFPGDIAYTLRAR